MIELLRRELLHGNVGHAYIFLGDPEATEREARAFALALNCLDRQDGMACGQCRHCRLAASGSFDDFLVLEPEGVYYKVDQIRQVIKSAALTRREGDYTVFLLKRAEMMRAEGANALLKTLEEPEPGVIFLLTVENRDRLLATIESRSRLVRCIGPEQALEDDSEKPRALLEQIAAGDYALLFRTSEKLAKERDRASLFFAACADIFYDHYRRVLRGEPHGDALPWSDETVFALWEKTQRAPALLEHLVNTRLVVDDFLFTVQRVNGG